MGSVNTWIHRGLRCYALIFGQVDVFQESTCGAPPKIVRNMDEKSARFLWMLRNRNHEKSIFTHLQKVQITINPYANLPHNTEISYEISPIYGGFHGRISSNQAFIMMSRVFLESYLRRLDKKHCYRKKNLEITDKKHWDFYWSITHDIVCLWKAKCKWHFLQAVEMV